MQVIDRRFGRLVHAAGLEFDKIDSYGQLVSAKLRADRLQQAPKMYAYEVLDALHQRGIQPQHRPDLSCLQALPRPRMATPCWDTLFR